MNTLTRAVAWSTLLLVLMVAFLGSVVVKTALSRPVGVMPIAEAGGAVVQPSTPPPAPARSEAKPPIPSAGLDLSGPWKFSTDRTEVGQEQGWYKTDYDSNAWRTLNVPGAWEEQGITFENPSWPSTEEGDGYNGYAWYRRNVEVPASWTQAPVTLHLGAVDDSDWAYVNGARVGSTPEKDASERERSYLIPANVLRPGQVNVIAIQVLDRGGSGGITKGPVELLYGAGAAAEGRPARTTTGIRRSDEDIVIPPNQKVEGDVYVSDGSVTVGGYVTGNVTAQGGSVHLLPTARVDGNVTAVGGDVVRDNGAVVGGTMSNPPLHEVQGQQQRPPRNRVGAALEDLPSLVVLLIFGALAALLFPRRLKVMARALPAEPARAGVAGFVGLLLAPAAIVALALAAAFVTLILAIIVIVGWVAIPFLWLGVAAVLFGMVVIGVLGCLGVCLSLGQAVLTRLGRPDASPVWGTVLGVALIWVALALCAGLAAGFGLDNTVGGLLWVTIIIFGVGLALMTGGGTSDHWRPRLPHRPRASGPGPSAPAAGTPPPQGAATTPPGAPSADAAQGPDSAAADAQATEPDAPTT